jgi:alkanesulfonate monooxygenase SsuD/methylene tetrahydromethanopterin reductase-like flavin-dependent oxidoreductase (luciferase family)
MVMHAAIPSGQPRRYADGVTEFRVAIDICPLGHLSDPRAIVRLARAAEAAGWHGLSIWDSLGLAMGSSAADPFVSLAAVAQTTSRIRLITSVVALARRRAQLVIQAAASLDLLSDGRLILGLGAGEDQADFEAFGEPFERLERIGRMDEATGIVDAGLRGELLQHAGPRLRAAGVVVGPRPAQQPRPPIWLGAMRPGGIRRAARWDGWIAVAMSEDGASMAMSPAAFADRVRVAQDARHELGRAGDPFDIAVLGVSGQDAGGAAAVAAFRDAGATWWLESLSPVRGSLDELEALVRAGPPR